MQTLMQAFEIVTAGIAVASTGTMLAVVYLVFGPALEKEVREASHHRPL